MAAGEAAVRPFLSRLVAQAASPGAARPRQSRPAGAAGALPRPLLAPGAPRAQDPEAAAGAEGEALPQASQLAAPAAAPPAGRRPPGPAGEQGQHSGAVADEASSSPGPRSAESEATRRRHSCHFP